MISKNNNVTDVWQSVQRDAEAAAQDSVLRSFLQTAVLDHPDMGSALAALMGRKLGGAELDSAAAEAVCREALAQDPSILAHFIGDMSASRTLDPACRSWLQPFLYFKGVAALRVYRVTHWLWGQGREALAFHMQNLSSQVFQVDIHPAARLGAGIFLDHATGVVIGETSVVGDDVTIMQDVTLGGNGKEHGDRHPKIARGVLISAGAKVLGNIHVGEEARIAASSVVLEDVPPHVTVAGIPARIVRARSSAHPAQDLDHSFAAE